ncbi:DUF5672 family protein [Aureisphaera galaxeae]|uniref:DUF5672 family protein n=1 Tax=Aureisphaera galaxeae TaxID=1538023 RepID=UPI002350A59A|nr:DUF5672 family protein [Aureisphaera galaxeae]MDC8003752.1 DUF5672 family protein [Aureisphaera galaxeae]
MLQLDNVTLLGLDCIDIDRLIFAAEISQKKIRFKEVKLLTSLTSDYKDVVNIPPVTSIEEYSQFMIKELYKYVDTDYVLVIQHDGFVLNPESWTDDFLNYDYIGTLSIWGMGNGGFSLRSKKLLNVLATEPEINDCHPEDVQICRTYRSFLESKGIQFATREIAEKFGVERMTWTHEFGFHNANISLWDIDAYADPEKHAKQIAEFNTTRNTNGIELTYVVHFFRDNDQVDPLNELIKVYSSYSEHILKRIHFVFVDDHSKVAPVIPENIPLNYTLARVTDDIVWNQGGARNLGVSLAKSEKLILCDLDVLFPENLLDSILHFAIPDNIAFKFVTLSGMQRAENHFNVFFLTKNTYNKTQGIDEEFCGKYGYEDVFFFFLQREVGTRFYEYKYSNIVHKEHKHKAHTQHHSLIRDLDDNKVLFESKMEKMRAAEDPMQARSDLYLNFEWEVVQECIAKGIKS